MFFKDTLDKFKSETTQSVFVGNHIIPEKKNICYARVSSRGQKSDLQNQISLLKQQFPTHQVIFDYGSGLNFKRKGLLQIICLGHCGNTLVEQFSVCDVCKLSKKTIIEEKLIDFEKNLDELIPNLSL